MDEAEFKDIAKRIREVNKVVLDLDPLLKVEAVAIFRKYLGSSTRAASDSTKGSSHGSDDRTDAGGFFGKYEHKKEAENVLLIVAWLYSQHGLIDLTVDGIKDTADRNGLSIPRRVDMTLRQYKKDGKALFLKVGKRWRLTTPGERLIKENYSVRKGTIPVPEPEAK